MFQRSCPLLAEMKCVSFGSIGSSKVVHQVPDLEVVIFIGFVRDIRHLLML